MSDTRPHQLTDAEIRLGSEAEAIREGELGVTLLPITKDAFLAHAPVRALGEEAVDALANARSRRP